MKSRRHDAESSPHCPRPPGKVLAPPRPPKDACLPPAPQFKLPSFLRTFLLPLFSLFLFLFFLSNVPVAFANRKKKKKKEQMRLGFQSLPPRGWARTKGTPPGGRLSLATSRGPTGSPPAPDARAQIKLGRSQFSAIRDNI